MTKNIQSEAEFKKEQMIKKGRKLGLKFSIDDGTMDGGYEVVTCNKRLLDVDKNGRLVFRQEETPKLIWTLIMTFLGALVPGAMFLEDNIKMKIMAVGIFLAFQTGAILTVNVGRPEIRIFDKPNKKYWIRKPNHIFTILFRKSRVDVADLSKVTGIKLSSFTAKRWDMEWFGSDENRFRRQSLMRYENYRLTLVMSHSEPITIYDWYEMDHAMETGEKIAEYLGVEFDVE
ncbi:MAG: hypothetical protein JXQ65_02890 [Candidatus Marinimicrobia bacterium]|nr:hypothetical protein [Candidatus Neomarinimicrobiota bacterium]